MAKKKIKRPDLSNTAKSYTKIKLPGLQESKDALQKFSDEITMSGHEYRTALKGPVPPSNPTHINYKSLPPLPKEDIPTLWFDTKHKDYSGVIDAVVALAISGGFIAFGMAIGMMR